MIYNNKFISVFPRLIEVASKSTIKCQLAAAIMKGVKLISRPCSNISRNMCRGQAGGSLHAEAHAILDYFGKELKYSQKTSSFYVEENKKVKCDLIVIRINSEEKLCNSRPCYNCLDMMRAVGIRKVYYADNNENIICENVKDMVSINTSSVMKMIHRLKCEAHISDMDISEKLLKNLFPDVIKKINFQYFMEYDFQFALPKHRYIIQITDNQTYIIIYNSINEEVIKSKLID